MVYRERKQQLDELTKELNKIHNDYDQLKIKFKNADTFSVSSKCIYMYINDYILYISIYIYIYIHPYIYIYIYIYYKFILTLSHLSIDRFYRIGMFIFIKKNIRVVFFIM